MHPSTSPPATGATLEERGPGRFVALVLALAVAGLWAYNVARYDFVSDDAYISFRYARNFVEGHGLVFNPGERVEGYTNFLWVLIASAFLRLGIEPELPMNALGIASGAAILFLIARLGARRSSWGDPLIWIAPACLAANRTFAAWCTGGLATQFFSLFVLLALVAFLRERGRATALPAALPPARPVALPIGSALLFALATLTRPEGALPFGIAGLFFAYDAFVRRRRALRSMVVWALAFVLIVGAHVTWRYQYYGYLLPNTFYAKVSGFWWEQSKAWLGLFLKDHYLAVFLPLVLLALLRRDVETLLFGAVLFGYSAYLVYVGGDSFEFRLITPALPYLYWLLQEGIRALAAWRVLPRAAANVGACLVGLALVGSSYAPNIGGFDGNEHFIDSLEVYTAYTNNRVEEGRFLRGLVEQGYLSGDEVIAVAGAGALPYFSRLSTVDYHGLNDASIAHQKVTERGWIAHEKRASIPYLTERGVAIWDVKGRIVKPADAPRPRPHRVSARFHGAPVSCVRADGRYLVFATTLTREAFLRTFENCEIIFYRRATP